MAGIPVTQGNLRAFVPKGWTKAIITNKRPKELAGWRDAIATRALEARGGASLLKGPVIVALFFRLPAPKGRPKALHTNLQILEWSYPIRRPDADKLCRAALDAVKGILWTDDAQICGLHVQKVYATTPGLDVVVRPLIVAREPVAVG